MIIAAIIAILIGGGVYMIMQRGMLRLIVGITLLSHGVNLLILAAGIGAWRYEPLLDRATTEQAADPLPQAFVLTAIVISMASSAVMLVLAALGRDDDTRTADTPERSAQKLRALQTLGREAEHIELDSSRAAKRTQRDDAARGGTHHHGQTAATTSKKGDSK